MSNQTFQIFGGGVAGLAAAVSLARRGAGNIRLLEHSSRLGGRAATNKAGRFSLNLGPHALYRGGSAYRTLQDWGIPTPGGSPTPGPDSYFVLHGERHRAFAKPADLLFSKLLTFREKLDAARALSRAAKSASTVPRSLSVRQWLDREVSTGTVRLLMAAYLRLATYSNDPDHMPAGLALRQFDLALKSGVVYLDGGWQSMIDGLEREALRLGVRIERGIAHAQPVERGAILAVPPQQASQILGTKAPSTTPVRMACLDLCLAELPPGAATFALGLDQPLYLSVHSQWAKLIQGKGAVVHLGKYLGTGSGQDARTELESFADVLMPGWRTRVETALFRPEMVVTHDGFTVDRPRTAATSIPGVYLAGDWIGTEGMLGDAAFASGLHAAELAWAGNTKMEKAA